MMWIKRRSKSIYLNKDTFYKGKEDVAPYLSNIVKENTKIVRELRTKKEENMRIQQEIINMNIVKEYIEKTQLQKLR